MSDKPAMPIAEYRVYLRSRDEIVCRHELVALDDAEAIRVSELLAEATSDMCDFFEVWQGVRVVLRRQAAACDGLAHALMPPSGLFLAAAESLQQSPWVVAQSKRLRSRLETWRHRPDASLLERVIREAVAASGADTGNIQLRDGDGRLRIAAQHGHMREFLDYFAVVTGEGDTSCGHALKRAGRVIVEDVATDPIFRGKPAGAMLLRTGLRSTYSTPIRVGDEVHGILSTHRRINWVPCVEELRRIDRIVEDAAAVIG